MPEFERRQFEGGQFSQDGFAQNEFASSKFEQRQFDRSQFRRDRIIEQRFAQRRQQMNTFERRVFERRQFTIGDRDSETGQWEAIDNLGGVQFGEKIFNTEAVGQPVRYLGQTLDDISVDEAQQEAALFLEAGNCLGYLRGQIYNCEEEVQVSYGVVYAVALLGGGIVLGGDRAEPVLIEASALVVQVQRVGGKVVVYWAVSVAQLGLWVDGITTLINEGFPAFLGGGWRDTSLIESLGGGVRAGQLLLSDHLGNVTSGNVSGTTNEAGNESQFSGDRPIIAGITRPCSVQQTDASLSEITGSYDAHQSLMIRADGNRALVMHRVGTVGEGRSQTARVYVIDREGNETAVNSEPGLLVGLSPVLPVVGPMVIEVNNQFRNYLDGTPRPIFDDLIGLPIVLSLRNGGSVAKGFGTISAFSSQSNPGSLGGTTTLLTVTVQIERVISVPFEGALGVVDDCVLYSNRGSVIDFLLQTNIYSYIGGSGNLPGLGETGDLSATVPLANFNISGNNGVNGAAYAQWVGNKVYVSDSSQTARDLTIDSGAYADRWSLRLFEGVIRFVKSDRPLRSRKRAILGESDTVSLLSSAFYPT